MEGEFRMKTKRMLGRALALLLGVCMLWGLLPLSVSAVKENFITGNEISSVSLTGITAPAAQARPDMTVESTYPNRYRVVDVFWTPSISYGSEPVHIGENDFFNVSSAYTVHVILEAVGNYYFKTTEQRTSACKAVVNGTLTADARVAPYEYLYASGYDYDVQHTKLLEVMYTFPATAAQVTVDHVKLFIDEPVAGTAASSADMYFADEMIGKIRYEHRQNIMKLSWFHNGIEMKPTDRFVYGETYLASVYLLTYNSNVVFAVNEQQLLFGLPNTAVTAEINGAAATVLPNNQAGTARTHITVSMQFTCDEKQQIKNVDISNIMAPIAGEAADYTAELASKQYRLQDKNNSAIKNGIYWTVKDKNNVSQGDILVNDSIFKQDMVYAVTVKVVPSDINYMFASDAKVTFNGKTAENVVINPDEIRVTYTFPATETVPVETIEEVTITGVDLEPSDAELPLNENTKITPTQVTAVEFLWDTLPASKWRYGIADLTLAAEEGYVFTYETVVTVNGYYAHFVYISDNGKEAVIRCTFAPVYLETPKDHEHQYFYGMSHFEHWLECACGHCAAFGDHEMNAGNQCEVCGFKIYDISALPFVDVMAEDYFAQAVGWAYENGITAGTSDTTFSPDMTCTRAQVVTFLWRAAGCPEPVTTKNPFKDVKKTDWYYKAVLWAVEQNITQGTSAVTFDPQRNCSTAEILTFLFRAVGAGDNGWYEEAAAWAESLDLVYVTGLTVDPATPCPRKAIVSFLYGIYG